MLSGERAVPKHCFEVTAFDEPHRDRDRGLDLEHLVDRNDVGMIETRCKLRLGPQARAKSFICGELGGKELERDGAFEPQVLREVDDPHPAAAEHALDSIAEEFASDSEFACAGHRGLLSDDKGPRLGELLHLVTYG